MTTRKRGRPPIADESASVRIHVRVTPAQRLELRRVAGDNHTGVSGIIREAINEIVTDCGARRTFVRTKA